MLRITFNYNWIKIWSELVEVPPHQTDLREGCLWSRLTIASLGNGLGHVSIGLFPIGDLQSGVKTAETLLQRVLLVVFHQVLRKTSTTQQNIPLTKINQSESRWYCVQMYRNESKDVKICEGWLGRSCLFDVDNTTAGSAEEVFLSRATNHNISFCLPISSVSTEYNTTGRFLQHALVALRVHAQM